MVRRLYDLKTLRREFLRHRKHLGGRKDQRFLGKVAERQFTGRLLILSVNEKHPDFLGPGGGRLTALWFVTNTRPAGHERQEFYSAMRFHALL